MRKILMVGATVLAWAGKSEANDFGIVRTENQFGAVILQSAEDGFHIIAPLVSATMCPLMNGPISGSMTFTCRGNKMEVTINHTCEDQFTFLRPGRTYTSIGFDGHQTKTVNFNIEESGHIWNTDQLAIQMIVDRMRAAHYTEFDFDGPMPHPTNLTFNTYGMDRAIMASNGCSAPPFSMPGWKTFE